MPEFAKPEDFSFDVDTRRELRALREHREVRGVPVKQDDRLLLATWNVANFEVQEREEAHLDLIAEIVGWFDLVALQEIRDDVTGLRALKARLPRPWQILFSEAAGNDERQAFVYDSRKVAVGEKVGKLTVPPPSLKHAGGEGFRGFDRNPYLAGFHAGDLTFLLANVHSIWGGTGAEDLRRRTAETRAVAWWCDKRARDPNAYSTDIFALGDFNLPKAAAGDPVFDELTRRGLRLPEHQTVIGTTIAREEKHYDQVAYLPRHSQADLTGEGGVFDYDAVLFRDLWEDRGDVDYDRYAKWAISDHRPLWVELRT
ncbi:MAG TPA: endonuclease/exonuclease/phosphatase family protein [Thermoleophilaceae bacterium]|nr:endonuclease/exonuclease/phosphatase family protein [Thermoleophilaceae bacterium]